MSSSMIACKGGHKSGCVWQTGTMAYPFNGPLERQHTQFIVALVIDDVNVQVMEVEDDCIVQRRRIYYFISGLDLSNLIHCTSSHMDTFTYIVRSFLHHACNGG